MQNNQSSYPFWTWIIAIALAVVLLLMLLTGKMPSSTCCTDASASVAETETMEAAPVVTEAFSFTATENEFVSSGDASNINWAGESLDALKSVLAGGITAEGSERMIMLTGTVDSEDIKQQKELDAQTYFGPDTTIDNQITVMTPIIIEEPVAIIEPPTAAKLYFDTGVHRLPADSIDTLDPIITWLNNNPDSKAIISGFHDETGDVASNARLSKKRAESAYNALVTAGIDESRIELRKPESTNGGGDLSEARRVEVSIE